VVTAEKVGLMTIRTDSDQLLNVVGAEEFSKFAAGDVAEVLERVAGVNVVEGQFAIIRGLEDRYSSTTMNGAAVPSPDPDSQSVQLDLFPSEVVGNLSVVKNFSPGWRATPPAARSTSSRTSTGRHRALARPERVSIRTPRTSSSSSKAIRTSTR
jgi:hypothetical protein